MGDSNISHKATYRYLWIVLDTNKHTYRNYTLRIANKMESNSAVKWIRWRKIERLSHARLPLCIGKQVWDIFCIVRCKYVHSKRERGDTCRWTGNTEVIPIFGENDIFQYKKGEQNRKRKISREKVNLKQWWNKLVKWYLDLVLWKHPGCEFSGTLRKPLIAKAKLIILTN